MLIRSFLTCVILFASLSGCGRLPPLENPVAEQWTGHTGGSMLAFSRDSRMVATGGWEGNVRFWTLPDGKLIKTLRAHEGGVYGIVFLDDRRSLLTAGYDGYISRWDFYTRKLLQRVDTGNPVTQMVADAQRENVVVGHRNGSVEVFRVADLARVESRQLHDGLVKAVALGPDGLVASGGEDGEVRVWRLGDNAARRFAPPPTDPWSLAFSPDGKWLMAGGWFRLSRWQLADGSLQTMKTPHHGIIKSIAFPESGDFIASISRQTDSGVYFMDPLTGQVTRRFSKHALCGGYLDLSDDGHYLATTADDSDLRIWDLLAPVEAR